MKASIAAWRKSIELTSSGPELPMRIRFLVIALTDHWYCTEDPSVLSYLIATLREAILHSPDDHPVLPMNLYELGESLRIHIVFSRDLGDLDEAIFSLERAVSLTHSQDLATLSLYMDTLSRALSERHFRTEQVSDIHRAIEVSQKALELIPTADPIRTERLYFLGTLLDTRYEVLQNLEDIDRAILCFKEAMDSVPDADLPGCIDRMDCLARSLRNRFGSNKDLADIRLSINWYQKAIGVMPQEHPGLPQMLSHLGIALRASFRYTEDLAEIEEAIQHQRASINLTRDSDPALGARLCELGTTLEAKFSQTENLEDIQQALAALRQAVEVTPKAHPAMVGRLISLAEALESRSFVTGEDIDAEEAIAMLKDQVEQFPDGDPRLQRPLLSLSLLLSNKWSRTRNPEYLDQQIDALRRGVEMTARGHLGTWMNSLALAYDEKLKFTKELGDAEDALAAHRKAIDATPKGHATLPVYHASMAITLRDRFDITNDIRDIDEAISMRLTAFELASELEGYAALPVWYSGLGRCFVRRYSVSREVADIDKAIDAEGKAIECYQEGHTQLPDCHNSTGDYYILRFEASKMNEDRDNAILHFRLAALASVGSSKIRMEAARKWGKWTAGVDTESAMNAFERAIDLLSEHVAFEQAQSRRHENIANTSGLSTTAAAVALHAGRIEKALEWLERGRCLVWSQLNSLRTPLDELRVVDPDLANRFLRVSKELEMLGSERGTVMPKLRGLDIEELDQARPKRESVDLTLEWKQLVATVRQKPGFENFLQAIPLATLLGGLPDKGTVVIINAHDQHCDAIALRGQGGEPIHIPLPAFSLAKAKRMANRIREQLGMRGIRARGFEVLDEPEGADRGLRRMPARDAYSLKQALVDLWTHAVKPIFEGIGVLVRTSFVSITVGALKVVTAGRRYDKGEDMVVSDRPIRIFALARRRRISRRREGGH
jgi:tetratricopeptide (TPR) repeat protein